MPKKQKEPRVNKSEEQIAFEMKQKAETARKRKFVSDVLFPFLKNHTKTTREAQMLCKVAQNDILTSFNGGMNAPISSLKLGDKFKDETDEGAKVYVLLAKLFEDVPINETLELLDGMPQAIDAALTFENRERNIGDLTFNNGTILAQGFHELLAKTPECNDFRQLADGVWVAYSTRVKPGESSVYTGRGKTIQEALAELNKNLL